MKVSIVGAGYVGITTGVALAYLGHTVTLLDSDAAKIALLRKASSRSTSPSSKSSRRWRSRASATPPMPARRIAGADVIFIAVGTPPLADGNPDLSYLRAAATAIGERLGDILHGGGQQVHRADWLRQLGGIPGARVVRGRHGERPKGRFSVASNPEFLREGSALHDSLYPDRVVVGSDDPRALECALQPLPARGGADVSGAELPSPARVARRGAADHHQPGVGGAGEVRRQRFSGPQDQLHQRGRATGREGGRGRHANQQGHRPRRAHRDAVPAGRDRLGRLVLRQGHLGADRHSARVQPDHADRGGGARGELPPARPRAREAARDAEDLEGPHDRPSGPRLQAADGRSARRSGTGHRAQV